MEKASLAKNTLLLYVRQIITVVIGLYTSRIVLQVLGVNDFGVYNVVGGLVAMMAFLNSALTASSQRFLAYELGKSSGLGIKRAFSVALRIHLQLALVVLLLAETIGLLVLNRCLNIAQDRLVAANWVYQSAVVVMVITVINVPYNAALVAHERMGAFAYLSLAGTVLKLGVACLLFILPGDALIGYSILTMGVQLCIQGLYILYCRRAFWECRGKSLFDAAMYKSFFSFAGWSVLGNLGFAFKDQMANMILNLFFGTNVNAAKGLAMQIGAVAYNFSSSFTMAINPRIVKSYSSNGESAAETVYKACRIAPLLMGIISIPIMVNIDSLTRLWLGADKVPEYTGMFVFLTLIVVTIASAAAPIVAALQATGKIKVFQIVISLVMLSELPIAYVLLLFGVKPYITVVPTILVTIVGLYARFLILRGMEPQYSMLRFNRELFRALFVLVLAYGVGRMVTPSSASFISALLSSMIAVTVSLLIVFGLGLERTEKNLLLEKIKRTAKRS